MKNKFILLCAITATLLIAIAPITTASDTLEITNPSHDSQNFTYQQLTEMPQTTVYAELYCYGSLVTMGNWNGIQLSYLLTQANATAEAKSIQFRASDGYVVTIPIEVAMAPETIIAYQIDGEPLSEGLRLVLPGINGASWIAKIISITASNMGAETPAPAGASLPNDGLIKGPNDNTQSSPTPTLTPTTTQPTTKPTPDNSTPNPSASPANITEINPTTKPQNKNYNLIDSEWGTIAAIIAVLTVSLAIVTIFAIKRKIKPKNSSLTSYP
jgi:hypothetical protein